MLFPRHLQTHPGNNILLNLGAISANPTNQTKDKKHNRNCDNNDIKCIHLFLWLVSLRIRLSKQEKGTINRQLVVVLVHFVRAPHRPSSNFSFKAISHVGILM